MAGALILHKYPGAQAQERVSHDGLESLRLDNQKLKRTRTRQDQRPRAAGIAPTSPAQIRADSNAARELVRAGAT